MIHFFSILTLICLASSGILAQSVFRIDSLPEHGVLLDKGWKFHAGDNPDWAKPDFDDSTWETIDPTRTIFYLPQIRKQPIGWFRINIHVDSNLLHKPLAFYVYQSIASEIYLDGKFLKRFGVVSSNKEEIKAIQPLNEPVGFQFDKPDQVLAVRFSVQLDLSYFKYSSPLTAFKLGINDVWGAGQFNRIRSDFPVLHGVYIGLFIVLTIIHFGFFLLHKKQKANLFFSLATFSAVLGNYFYTSFSLSHNVSFRSQLVIGMNIFYSALFNLFLLVAVYHLFSRPRKVYFWCLIVYSLTNILFYVYERNWFWGWGTFFPILLTMLESLRVSYSAYRQKFHDAGIIVFGVGFYLVFSIAYEFITSGLIANKTIGFGDQFTLVDLLYHIWVNVLPLALSFYFFRNFAFTSSVLEKKLVEVQQLSEEKQQILATQNENLEIQVAERTFELNNSLEKLKATQAQLIQKEKLASLGELTAGIAHEIQNPLNFVNNFSEVSTELVDELHEEHQKPNRDNELETGLLGDLKQNLQKITHHGHRASAIVKGMLEHSRTRTGPKEPTDINALAEEYLRLAYQGRRAKDKAFNAGLDTDFAPDLGPVEVVPQEIGRVLLNLFNNAFYAVHEKQKTASGDYQPTVSVSTLQAGGSVKIWVKDNGTGISESVKAKIFQPFFTTKPTGEGTGLGLSLSYDTVTKGHGGTLEMESQEGKGTTFIIRLPVNQS